MYPTAELHLRISSAFTLMGEGTDGSAISRGEIYLESLDSLHQRWVLLLRSLKPEDFARKLNHPEFGHVTLEKYLAMYAWHGKHHVAHITNLRQRAGWNSASA